MMEKTCEYTYHKNMFGNDCVFRYDANINVDFKSDYGTIENCKVNVSVLH